MSYNRRARDNTGPYAKVRINKNSHLAGRHTHSLSQYLYYSLSRFQSFSPLLIFFVSIILSPFFIFFVSIILSPPFILFLSTAVSDKLPLFFSPSLFLFFSLYSLFLLNFCADLILPALEMDLPIVTSVCPQLDHLHRSYYHCLKALI